ncbi:hypothetical protein [Actinoplanes aureus]|uniref:hypothetical protein n=1 Tax=Actinoplanes aureus TaxID=2792083 RepID=UPI001E65A3B3|nr:hypothetical protein [Actinoplanes aureus]
MAPPGGGAVYVVAQWVSTEWTRNSRGGEAAARRNAIPVGFRLPASRTGVVHEIVMTEGNGFEPVESLGNEPAEREPSLARCGLRLVRSDERVRVELLPARSGAPSRDRRPSGIWLGPGQWLRWQVNYRVTWPPIQGGRSSYRQDTLNLAVGPVHPELFFGTPTRHVDERAYLR